MSNDLACRMQADIRLDRGFGKVSSPEFSFLQDTENLKLKSRCCTKNVPINGDWIEFLLLLLLDEHLSKSQQSLSQTSFIV